MKHLRWFNLLLVVTLSVAFLPLHSASAAPAAVEIDRNSLYVPGEVVVAFKDGLASSAYGAQANALAGQVGATVAARYYNYALLSFPVDADVPAMVDKVAATGLTQVAQPNYVSWIPEYDSQMGGEGNYEIDGTYVVSTKEGKKIEFSKARLAAMRRIVKNSSGKITAIPTFPSEFTYEDANNTNGWDLINAEVVYRDTTATTAVCVIDTGVDYKHPDLYGKVINGYDFVNNDTLPNDDNGHGTHVAGTITAKGNNGASTALGINLGKVVAVKVLTAYGWGTSFSISAGIRYCATRTDVKVLNMSLGSDQANMLEYYALRYAIVTKGKLVVAAAGNDSTSALHFPSSWAKINVNVAGIREAVPAVPPVFGVTNEISNGLISVAAANVNPMPLANWINVDNSTNHDDGEDYGAMDCAVEFTNYGDTVSIVAPGMWIYSTTPVSYAFFENQFGDAAAGYDDFSGTSMATPHVAAAAARVWGLNKLANNAAIKTLLVDTGRELDYSYDPYEVGVDVDFDPTLGFNQGPYGLDEFGWIDGDGDEEYLSPNDDYIKSPFCWPADTTDSLNPFGPNEDMSEATYLDLAAAMGRYMTVVGAADATSSMPLEGALIRVQQYNPILKVTQTKDTSKVTRYDPWVLLTNLPDPELNEWKFAVQKSGYTSSYQMFSTFQPISRDDWFEDDGFANRIYIPVDGQVTVPPAKDIQVVADWYYPGIDLDLYVWLPETSAAKGIVGPGVIDSYQPSYITERFPECTPGSICDYGTGTLLTNAQIGLGSNVAMPFAQRYTDGYVWPGEATAIKMKPYTSYPFWYINNVPYHILLTDYSGNYGGFFHDQDNALNYAFENYPTVRFWYKGVLKANMQLYKIDDESCAHTETFDWWYVASINGTSIMDRGTCGNADPASPGYVLPY